MENKQRGDLKITRNTVVHCKTEALAKRVLQVAHDLGYAWDGGSSYLAHSAFEVYQSETAYNLHEGCYCEIDYYRHKQRKIISAEEFLKLHGKWEEPKEDGIERNVDVSGFDVSNANKLKRLSNNPKSTAKVTIITKDGITTLEGVEWHFPKNTTYETANHITLHANDWDTSKVSSGCGYPTIDMTGMKIIDNSKPPQTPADLIDLRKLPIGTKVWSVELGDCTIRRINPSEEYCIKVFAGQETQSYTIRGHFYTINQSPTLAPSKEAFLANPLNPWGTYDFSQHITPEQSKSSLETIAEAVESVQCDPLEESPYNEDGSIKKGWVCEFWDENLKRYISFFSHATKSDYPYKAVLNLDGSTSVGYKNCRPIPRSEWADWAVEAHKTLKL